MLVMGLIFNDTPLSNWDIQVRLIILLQDENLNYFLQSFTYLKKIAKRNNVLDSIVFLGPLTHEKVLETMKNIIKNTRAD